MNNLYCSLFIIALCVGLSNAVVKMKNSVHFMNSLGGNNVLKIHCISDEDDLGYHLLKPGEIYEFSFYDSVMGTRINCDVAQGIEFRFHAKFMAYKGGGLIGHYGKMNFWFCRDDGIYFTHGKDDPKLEYKWVPTMPLTWHRLLTDMNLSLNKLL
ncbi:PREDICTED: uncharacterized protein LOC106329603 [Brassica oleracea var. oleracea]|uniref:S-protein homolog n=2 Tax=Brassica oleracea TaxID=3712 RepID=A0A0D3AZL1_BRAOL|nr:PREDICTED: uncharacterized protein LOC106329603 [Brassica oleracea var. oleracea]VDC85129.1 unnamed protein product [Brassica oleracea]